MMRLCAKMLTISWKEKSIYRFDYFIGTIFAFLYLVLKVYLWRGLYGGSGENVNGVVLNDMIVYSIAAGFAEGVTKTSVMNDLNNSVLNGSISVHLLLPVGLKKYMFMQSVSRNVFQTICRVAPSVLAAVLVFDLQADIRPGSLGLYLCSVGMGILINFLYHFLFGSSVIWFRNSFFLNNFNSVLWNLFSGALIPLWFFPEKLRALSELLPFQYILFEPVAILVEGKSPLEVMPVLGMQLFWICVLSGAVTFVWRCGRRKLMIQGG